MTLALVDGNERVDLLHPVLVARLEALFADPRMRRELKVDSAARTRAEQDYLYRHQPPFAASPNEVQRWAYGLQGRGSWHMVQSDGYAYAVDLNVSALSWDVYTALPKVAAEYRLQQTVLTPGIGHPASKPPPAPCAVPKPTYVREWWHFQIPLDESAPLTWIPDQEDVMTPAQEKKLDKLLADQATVLKRTDLILASVEGHEREGREAPIRGLLGRIIDKVGA